MSPKESNDCAVCLDPVVLGADHAGLQSCPHVYHYECIYKWSQFENVCPLCKKRFTKILRYQASNSISVPVRNHKQRPPDDIYEGSPEPEKCVKCGVLCSNERFRVECSRCDDIFHSYCLDVDGEIPYEWKCEKCSRGVFQRVIDRGREMINRFYGSDCTPSTDNVSEARVESRVEELCDHPAERQIENEIEIETLPFRIEDVFVNGDSERDRQMSAVGVDPEEVKERAIRRFQAKSPKTVTKSRATLKLSDDLSDEIERLLEPKPDYAKVLEEPPKPKISRKQEVKPPMCSRKKEFVHLALSPGRSPKENIIESDPKCSREREFVPLALSPVRSPEQKIENDSRIRNTPPGPVLKDSPDSNNTRKREFVPIDLSSPPQSPKSKIENNTPLIPVQDPDPATSSHSPRKKEWVPAVSSSARSPKKKSFGNDERIRNNNTPPLIPVLKDSPTSTASPKKPRSRFKTWRSMTDSPGEVEEPDLGIVNEFENFITETFSTKTPEKRPKKRRKVSNSALVISEVKSHLYDLQRDNQDREVFKVVAERATKRIIKMWKEKLRVDDSIGDMATFLRARGPKIKSLVGKYLKQYG